MTAAEPMAGSRRETAAFRQVAGEVARKAISRTFPTVRTQFAMAFLRGRLHRRILGVPGHVRENLESALGGTRSPRELDGIADRYIEFSKRLYLMNVLPRLRDFHDPWLWLVQGREHLDRALTESRGVVLLTGHFGYGRLIPHVLRVHGYEVLLVVHAEPGARVGAYEIPAGLDVRPIFRALAGNGTVLSTGDGMAAAEFVRLSLLDKPYPYPTGMIKIAMMTEASVLPVFACEGDRRLPVHVVIHPPLPIDASADVAANVGEFANVLDRQLRAMPHLYNRWSRKRWFETVLRRSELSLTKRYLEVQP